MLGWEQLKPHIQITYSSVECPVRGCPHAVKRQRVTFQRHDDFRCPRHGIYISPSTFEYESDSDNMLWATDDDLALWRAINTPGVKRESRVTRDNSQDAVTWNVFRFMEKSALVGPIIDLIAGEPLAVSPRLIYWSYSQSSHGVWQPLLDAADIFGEAIDRRSEPDLVIEDNSLLVFVENKFQARNRTKPSAPEYPKRYSTGAERWFAKVFASSTNFRAVAVADELYQPMRLWLLGSWIADQAGKQFIMVNILRSQAHEEWDIEARFGKHIQASPQRRFLRATWEWIYREFVRPHIGTSDADRLAAYFTNKTIGYQFDIREYRGVLQRAFDLRDSPNGTK